MRSTVVALRVGGAACQGDVDDVVGQVDGGPRPRNDIVGDVDQRRPKSSDPDGPAGDPAGEGLARYADSLPQDGAIDEGLAYWWNGACRVLEAASVLRHASDGAQIGRAHV